MVKNPEPAPLMSKDPARSGRIIFSVPAALFDEPGPGTVLTCVSSRGAQLIVDVVN